MLRDLAYATIDRGRPSGNRGHGRPARNEQAGAVMVDQAVRRLSVLLVVAVTLVTVGSVSVAQAEPMPNGIPGSWQLKLNEEFTSAGLNTALWTPGWQSDASISGPMSNECVASKNVSQPGNGYLYLQVRKEHATCGTTTVEDTGGLIESNPSDGQPGHSGFAYTYGAVEWRAYVPGVAPTGRGCPKGGCLPDWPALWSLSSTNADEIDTMEGLETLGQACYHIHPPPGSEGPGACLSGSYAGWHTYASEWEPGVVKYFYDGAQVGELSSGQLNGTPQYLIADMVPPGCCNQPLVVPDEMVVDYVRVWQHPLPPAVSTSAASGIQQEQATLNGTVNPEGLTTHYYFEYGTTTGYGHTEPMPSGNEATASGPVSVQITGLTPGTTYHYRIVATSSAGTSEGSDQIFTTVPRANPTVLREASNEQWVYYVGGDGNIFGRYFNPVSPGGWGTYDAGSGEAAAPGTSPTVVREPKTNEQWIYYVGANGNIWGRFYNSAKPEWSAYTAGTGEAALTGTSPAVVRESKTDEQWIYYVGADGNIWGRFYNSAKPEWSAYTAGTGEAAAPGTSPVVVREPSTNMQWIYYMGADGNIWGRFYNSTSGKWETFNAGTGEGW